MLAIPDVEAGQVRVATLNLQLDNPRFIADARHTTDLGNPEQETNHETSQPHLSTLLRGSRMAPAQAERVDSTVRASETITCRQNGETIEPRPNASEEDESVHNTKRRRVAKACHRCRRTKLKCDGAVPHCGTCLKAKKPCSYEPTIRKRGLKTGYVRILECLWGLVFQSIEGSEKAVELLISHTTRNGFWVGDEIRHGSNTSLEAPLDKWKSSKVLKAIDALLSTSEDNPDDEDIVTMLDAGPTTDVDLGWTLTPISSSIQSLQPANLLPDFWYIQEPPQKPSCSFPGPSQSLSTAPAVARETSSAPLDLPQNAQRLLDQYFALGQSWLPILERHAVYRSLFAYRKVNGMSATKNCSSGEEGVLWAIFAYSTVTKTLSENGGATIVPAKDDSFYAMARSMIPSEGEDNYSIGHVQTLLILGLIHYSACQWKIARLVIGQAILIASHIELDCLDTCQVDHYRRTWLGCFVLDTLTSANVGKSPRIQSHQVRLFFPLDEAGNEEWEPWRLHDLLLPGVEAAQADIETPTHALTAFNALLQLLCITNDWMCSVTGSASEQCSLDLRNWWECLPEHIQTIFADIFSPNKTKTSSTPPPGNILNLSVIYQFLCTVFSRSVSPSSSGISNSQAWGPLIHELERFSSHFDENVLPASFNLVRVILTGNTVHDCSLSELIAILNDVAHNGQASLDEINAISNIGDPFKGHEAVTAPDTGPSNLSSRIEENFTSFMSMSAPWSNISAELLLNMQDMPGAPESQGDSTTTLARESGHMSSHTLVPEEAALGNFGDWENTEIDRELFRKNLGFTV